MFVAFHSDIRFVRVSKVLLQRRRLFSPDRYLSLSSLCFFFDRLEMVGTHSPRALPFLPSSTYPKRKYRVVHKPTSTSAACSFAHQPLLFTLVPLPCAPSLFKALPDPERLSLSPSLAPPPPVKNSPLVFRYFTRRALRPNRIFLPG